MSLKVMWTLCRVQSVMVMPQRLAGHSKWQNIRHTKDSNDKKRGTMVQKFCVAIRKAVSQGGPDPKTNSALASIMASAIRATVPKDTVNRQIERAQNVVLRKEMIELMGPGGSFILLDIETDNISRTRHDLKGILKKVKGTGIMREGAAKHAFEERGVIRINGKKKDGTEISMDLAEEVAININAEEVNKGEEEDYIFLMNPFDLFACKGNLERVNPDVDILDAETRFLALTTVPLSDEDLEKAASLCESLNGLEEVNHVYDNIRASTE